MTRSLVVSLFLLCCSSATHAQPFRAPPAGPADGARIVCNFAWRPAVTQSFRRADQRRIQLTIDRATRAFRLGELDVTLDYELRSTAPNPGLHIAIGAGGRTIAEDDYRFPGGAMPNNLPRAGHGFTGLSYVTPPDGTGELQHQCVVARPGDPSVDDGWVIGRPGPAAPAGSHVVCDATLEVPGAAPVRRRLDLGDPTLQRGINFSLSASAQLGPFHMGLTYFPGNFESGAAIVDVSNGQASVRAFHQTVDDELPASLADGGYTGRRTHTAANGARLRYTCQAAR